MDAVGIGVAARRRASNGPGARPSVEIGGSNPPVFRKRRATDRRRMPRPRRRKAAGRSDRGSGAGRASAGLASGAGCSPRGSRAASTKLSIALRTQAWFLTAGGCGRTGGTKDQSGWYSAPAAIHCRNRCFSSALSCLCDTGGGMTSAKSAEDTRRINSLSCGVPGARTPLRPRLHAGPAADRLCERHRPGRGSESSFLPGSDEYRD